MLHLKTVTEFVNELASNSPAPGGGSVAALSASIGAALSSMVFNLTVGKKAYREYNDENRSKVDSALEESNILKDEFIDLMNKDTEEFLVLMKAFKLPKDTDEEKKVRQEEIQKGYVRALEIPLRVGEKAFDVYSHIKVACELGNKNAVSDAGVAALMIQAAIESAVLNVKINLSSIKNDNLKVEVTEKCNKLVIEGRIIRDEILEKVNAAL